MNSFQSLILFFLFMAPALSSCCALDHEESISHENLALLSLGGAVVTTHQGGPIEIMVSITNSSSKTIKSRLYFERACFDISNADSCVYSPGTELDDDGLSVMRIFPPNSITHEKIELPEACVLKMKSNKKCPIDIFYAEDFTGSSDHGRSGRVLKCSTVAYFP